MLMAFPPTNEAYFTGGLVKRWGGDEAVLATSQVSISYDYFVTRFLDTELSRVSYLPICANTSFPLLLN